MNAKDYESYEEEEEEEDNDEVIQEEYKIWKKNSPLLYDSLITHYLKYPSLTVEWFPLIEVPDKTSYKIQRLLLGTHTNDNDQNQLLIMRVKLPCQEAVLDINTQKQHKNEYHNITSKIDVEMIINHEGEVNKARIMPQNNNIIASKTVSGQIHIYDLNSHPAKPKDNLVKPEMRLGGHDNEGFGLSWSPLKDGFLLSGANDNKVCLYDIKSNNSEPIRIYKFHTNIVGDVAFSNLDDNIFGSVGDDKRLIIYDIRQENPIFNIEGHQLEINSLDFNFFNKNLVITSSNDKIVALWDMRNLSRRLHTFDQHSKEVITCKWSPKIESLFFSSSNDRRINIWDLSKIGVEQSVTDAEDGPPELLFTHGGHTDRISDISWNPNEELSLASVAEDSIMHIWEMARYIYYGEDEDKDDDEDEIKIDNN